MAPLVAVIIWLGVYPAPVLRRMETASRTLVTRVEQGAQTVPGTAAPIMAETSTEVER